MLLKNKIKNRKKMKKLFIVMFVLIGITTAKAQSAAELARYSQAERVRYLGVIGQSKIELTF